MFNNFPSLCSTFVVFQLLFTAQFPPKVRAMFCGIKALKYQMMEDISNDDGNGERGEEKGKISNQKLDYLKLECGSANVEECSTKIVVFVANLIEINLKGCEWDSAKSECVPNKEAKEFVSLGEGEKKKKVKKKKQGKWRTKRKN